MDTYLNRISISHLIPFNLRGSLHGVFTVVFIVFCFHQKTHKSSHSGVNRVGLNSSPRNLGITTPPDCTGLSQHEGYESECEFLIAFPQCDSDGFFNYLTFFYCSCQNHTFLGYILLFIWLAALFYLLGNTAADYFCCSLEKLSNLLRLPPTVAGVTLLPLGNGAPDVFASIAAFAGSDNGDVGLNSILGGAIFVTCVVVGMISICVADQIVNIDMKCFIRDVSMFLFAVVSLGVILFIGEVGVGGAIAFVSIYVVYATLIAANESFRRKDGGVLKGDTFVVPLLAVGSVSENRDQESLNVSFSESDDVPQLVESKVVPQWMWGSNVAIYSDVVGRGTGDGTDLWGWEGEETENDNENSRFFSCFSCFKVLGWLEFPLVLPRRLTIPIIEEGRWSKSYAVASVTFAPLLLSLLWNTQHDGTRLVSGLIYSASAVIGCVLGCVAFICTKSNHPPQKWLLPWVLGGFFMSIIWFYMIANELVALLVAFGLIFGINPSILGLTVLAWGNSMGDLMSNIALAVNGGEGVQIAISGCYAGPMFNILAGLGICMLIGSWSNRPEPYMMAGDIGLFWNIGFLVVGLVWSLVMLPRNGMQPSRWFGIGLMAIYVVFLGSRVGMSIGSGSLNNGR